MLTTHSLLNSRFLIALLFVGSVVLATFPTFASSEDGNVAMRQFYDMPYFTEGKKFIQTKSIYERPQLPWYPSWKRFSEKYPDQVSIRIRPVLVEVEKDMLRRVAEIHEKVMRRKYNDDLSKTGNIDQWDLDPEGDCDDRVWLTRKKLHLELGIPLGAMRFTIVSSKKTGGHSVLVLRTIDGDFVLDSLSLGIHRWQDLPGDYNWVIMYRNGIEWERLYRKGMKKN